MKQSPERNGLMLGFGLSVLVLGWVSVTSYQNAAQLIESTNKSKQTYTVIQDLMQIFSLMTVAESGRRGYLFLGDESEWRRYRQAVQDLEPALQILRQDIADAPQQMRRMVKLETLLNQRIDLLDQSIELRRQRRALPPTPQDPQQAMITQESMQLRDQIQAVLAEMQWQEEQLLQQWLQRSQTNIRDRLLIEGLITGSIFAALIVIYVLLGRQSEKQQQAKILQDNLRQEQELHELQLRLFAMVSHEFRTPLTVILGSAQLLTGSQLALTPERVLKSLHRIESAAKLMIQLLNHILTLSRAEVGTLEFTPKPVDVEAFCLNLVEDMQLLATSPRSLKFSRCGTCDYANLDEKLLYAILSNLLANALRYSAPDTAVDFQMDGQPGMLVFRVQDWGKGIPPEDIPQIFEPFHRGQNVTEIAGSGLGLAVVKKCVERHGGKIAVTSQLGQGTTFTVCIPQNHIPQNHSGAN
jgi:signal transduction histidine kinase